MATLAQSLGAPPPAGWLWDFLKGVGSLPRPQPDSAARARLRALGRLRLSGIRLSAAALNAIRLSIPASDKRLAGRRSSSNALSTHLP